MQHAKVQSATLHLHEDEVLHEAVGNVLYNAMSTVKDWGVCNLHVRRVQVAEKSDILSNAKKTFLHATVTESGTRFYFLQRLLKLVLRRFCPLQGKLHCG